MITGSWLLICAAAQVRAICVMQYSWKTTEAEDE
jgi:hypothetical protein